MNTKVKGIEVIVEERKPRSIRLNKSHRADILNSVMKQWEVVNPAPSMDAFEHMFIQAVNKCRKVRRNLPSEQRAFANSLVQAINVMEAYDNLLPLERDFFTMKITSTIMLRLVEADGSLRNEYLVEVPAALATTLGLPVCKNIASSRYGEQRELNHYWKKSEQNNYWKCDLAFIPGKQPLVIVIPADDKICKEYKENTKASAEWHKERTRQQDEVSDYLEQFNTTGQVREAWPELVQYLPAHIADPEKVITLPALTKSRLNERLGLK
jgi:hypothetical protein